MKYTYALLLVLFCILSSMPALAYSRLCMLDSDNDGVMDYDCSTSRIKPDDNCVDVKNGNCDDSMNCDVDKDGIVTKIEMEVGNQADSDGDGIGDACTDLDDDGYFDAEDTCPAVPNPDGDEDVCTDKDKDGMMDNKDNCPNVSNPDQMDSDKDGVGNACDNCRFIANTGQEDENDNGKGNACDLDKDNDGRNDTNDNCPFVSNPNQADADGDKLGDVCDTFADIDKEPTADDNPPIQATGENGGCSLVETGRMATAGLGWAHGLILLGLSLAVLRRKTL